MIDAGRILAVGCDDSRVRWFNLAERQECAAAVWLPAESVVKVAIAPGGAFLSSFSGKTLGVWQVAGPLRPSPPSQGEHVEFTYDDMTFRPDRAAFLLGQPPPDGLRLNLPGSVLGNRPDLVRRRAAAGGQFDVASGRPIGPPLYPWSRHPTYSPDGRLIAATRTGTMSHDIDQGPFAGVWEAASGRPVTPLMPIESFVHSLKITPDNHMVVAGHATGIDFFEIPSGRFLGHGPQSGPVSRFEVAAGPAGPVLAAGTRSGWGNTPGVCLWDLTMLRQIAPIFQCKALPFFRFDPSGNTLIVLDLETRRLARLDVRSGMPVAAPAELEQVHALPKNQQPNRELSRSWQSVSVALSLDAKVLAEASGAAVVRQWNVVDAQPVGPALLHAAPVVVMAYSPDGTTLACGSLDGAVRFWDTATGQLLGPALHHGTPLLSLVFTLNNVALVVVTREGKAVTWPTPRANTIDRPELLKEWVETTIGIERRPDGTTTGVSSEDWRSRIDRLADQSHQDTLAAPSTAELLASWHQARAIEMDRQGLSALASRHRTEIDALRPGDWTMAARRAAALAAAGNLDAADAEYRA